ncbi:MAG TPA: SusC/RagA family TonB-linked outer membrane protein, partial [Bacteroidales bacterium]|nr:SusC/RagA family TonB-linked outer membrane protein [Bacteroidales bacterium]
LFSLLLFACSLAIAQTVQISGTVTSSEDGLPVPGVSVIVRGTTLGSLTDVEGKYIIAVPQNAQSLVFSFIGFRTHEAPIQGQTRIDVVLEQDLVRVDEVVVTALGIRRDAKALGYSVQSVGTEDLTRSGAINPVNSLGVKVAGVQVTNSTGAAGGSSFITIRGMSSITGNNQPLFIVDGIPIDNSQLNTETGTAGVAYSNRAIDLNPSDIESMNVLKGGAATALYGIRAANGVVIITTKKGGATAGKKLNIQFSSSVSTDQVTQLPQMQLTYAQGSAGVYNNAQTNAWGPPISTLRHSNTTKDNYYYDAGLGDFKGVIVPSSAPDAGDAVVPVDNMKDFFVTGLTTNNNISFSGGNDATRYYFSVGYLNAKGIVPRNEWSRASFNLNGEHRFTKWLTTGAKITYANSGGTRIQQGSNTSGVMLSLARQAANWDNGAGFEKPWLEKQSYQFADYSQRNQHRGGGYDNPYWSVNNNPFTDKVDRVTASANAIIAPTDWMNVTYRIGTDFYSDRRRQFYEIGSRTIPAGRILEDNYFVQDLTQDVYLTLNREITPGLRGNLIIGNNMYQTSNQNMFMRGTTLVIPDYRNMSNASTKEAFESLSRRRTAAWYTDLGLSWESMIFLNATYRHEWSTSLPTEFNNFGFPSISGSFVFTELETLKGNNILNFGKVRASFSKIGNDAPIYGTAATYPSSAFGDGWTTTALSFPAFGTSGFTVTNTLPNGNLRPEKTTTWEAGIDVRFLNGRAGLDFTYYEILSEDLILAVPVAKSSGYYSANLNAGSMENKGIEVVLTAIPVRTKDFSWDININYTRNRNKVLSLAEGVPNVSLGGFTSAQARAVVGNSYGSIFGSEFRKDASGNLIIDDRATIGGVANAKYGWPILSPADAALGDVLPNWTMGITNGFSYKGITLSFLIDIKNGGYMWNGTRGAMYQFGTHLETADRGAQNTFTGVGLSTLNAQNEGTAVSIPMTLNQSWFQNEGGGFFGAGSQFVEQTDWVRLREVTISYTLPREILNNVPIEGAEVYFTGRNLWIDTPFTGVDPETSLFGASNAQGLEYFNMPGTKTLTFGLKLNF